MNSKVAMLSAVLGVCSISSAYSDEVIVPYFNTNDGWSARYTITNPTNEKLAVTVKIHDVDGKVVKYNHYVLTPHDAISSAIRHGSEPNTSNWFVPADDTTCQFYPNDDFPVKEGYVTVGSESFATFGPGGFCGNNYETNYDVKTLYYDYSLWDSKGLVNLYNDLIPVTAPVRVSWTQHLDRSTDWVINLDKTPPEGQCQSFEYLISNRDGESFQTYDVTEPGPGGWANFELCHKVNVVHFGSPIFNTAVGVNANDQMFFMNNENVFIPNAGWAQLLTSGQTVKIRSVW